MQKKLIIYIVYSKIRKLFHNLILCRVFLVMHFHDAILFSKQWIPEIILIKEKFILKVK